MMTLPQDCSECQLAKWEYYWFTCPLLEKTWEHNTNMDGKRRKGCPLPKILKPTETK